MELPSSFLNAFTLHPGSTTMTESGRHAAREDGIDEAVGLRKRNGGHGSSRLAGVDVNAPTITQSARRLGGSFY
jgi:hypothetical protein